MYTVTDTKRRNPLTHTHVQCEECGERERGEAMNFPTTTRIDDLHVTPKGPHVYLVSRVISEPALGKYDVTHCYETIGVFKASSPADAAELARTQGYKASEGYKNECRRVMRRMKEGWR